MTNKNTRGMKNNFSLIIMHLSLLFMFTSVVSADFTRDDSTQIVTDNTTTLQWQDDSNASSVRKTWTEAIDYCEALTLGGYDDWRLPNFNELYSIADKTKRDPAIDSTFQHVVSNNYWSSSTVVGFKSNAWFVGFYSGRGNWYTKSYSDYIRCVRDEQP